MSKVFKTATNFRKSLEPADYEPVRNPQITIRQNVPKLIQRLK
ncbi:hypothetical protein [Parachlamydia acanthamoebae]|nr:hypothetical protein [Parachlamydia acanthamoebae]EFB40318.1 hypothetical protein pah_c209o048 [Parachlamydia acanthamoebae str. Hall's coccus]